MCSPGETGAGNPSSSARFGLAIGERVQREWIRHGEKTAEVEAVFALDSLPQLRAELAKEDLSTTDNSSCAASFPHPAQPALSERALDALSRLVELADRLVSIFGQHESRVCCVRRLISSSR